MGALISVIIPIYNTEKYLKQCIDSVLNQTYSNVEVILVDDGSSDKCGVICDEYSIKDKRIRVIHKENGGQSSARKAGVLAAVGSFITCVDSDDFIAPNYIETLVNSQKCNNTDLVVCGYTRVSGKKPNKKYPPRYSGYFDLHRLQSEIYPSLFCDKYNISYYNNICTSLIRKELFLKYQLDVPEIIKYGEDECVMKPMIFNANSMMFIHECSYYYRDNPESVMRTNKPRNPNEVKERLRYLFHSIDMTKGDLQMQMYRWTIKVLYNYCLSMFDSHDNYHDIKKKIILLLSDKYYCKCLKYADFIDKKAKAKQFILRHKIVGLMAIDHIYRRLR